MKTTCNNLTLLILYVIVCLVWVGLVAGTPAWGASIVSYFDVVEGESSEGPPYPTIEPTITKVFDKATPLLGDLPLEQVTFNYSVTPPELGTIMQASDSGGGMGTGGTIAALNCYLKMDSPAPPETTAVDIFLKVDSPSGGGTIVLGPESYGDSFFDIYFDAELPDGGIMTHHFHGELGSGGSGGEDRLMENLSFNSVVFDNPPAEAFDCYLTVEMNTLGPVVDPSIPLMTIELTGTYVPEPATLGLVAIGGLAMLKCRRK